MTTEKAIYQLTDLIRDRESFCHRDDFDEVFEQDIEALKVGIAALEKQVPKKYELFLGQDLCPTCNNTFGSDAIRKTLSSWKMDYCQYCGQALDWSDENG